MQAPISPWHSEKIQVESPDKTMWACIESPHEIAMGAPTFGELKISNGQTADYCNPSLVWSEDSRYLAIPQWFDSLQRLLVIDVRLKKRALAPGTYRVLELHSFSNGTIEGIDSPIYQPQQIKVDILNIF